jgi:hypothetical protein
MLCPLNASLGNLSRNSFDPFGGAPSPELFDRLKALSSIEELGSKASPGLWFGWLTMTDHPKLAEG